MRSRADSDAFLRAGALAGAELVKRFHPVTVLDRVSFSVARGTCLAILGPSGCGKSTLLNAVAGLAPLDAGELRLGDAILDAPSAHAFVPMHRRGFAMVFQDFSLWPHLSVAENVAFGLRVRRIGRGERERRVRAALARVRMEAYADRFPASLSGGQQQRVAIARALVIDPPMLLLDEPLSALDARLREELRDELAAIIAGAGVTTLFVTHDQAEAMALADRILVMAGGRIVQEGTPEEIYRRPRSAFVADFVGASNLIPFTVRDGRALLGDVAVAGFRPGRAEGHVMLRREAIRLAPADGAGMMAGRVVAVIYLGERYEVLVEVSPSLRIKATSDRRPAPGESVRLVIDPADLLVLDA